MFSWLSKIKCVKRFQIVLALCIKKTVRQITMGSRPCFGHQPLQYTVSFKKFDFDFIQWCHSQADLQNLAKLSL
jgi:hypothetical protein